MDEIILQAKNIFKSYSNGEKNLSVLGDLSLTAKQNEIITITGQSGSGKSTLLNILSTLDQPDSGIVEIDGQSIINLDKNHIAKIRNEKIGFVFQFHHLLSEFTALENVLMPVWIKDPNQNKKEEAIQLFDKLNLTSKVHYFPNQLSGGERTRIALIRGIINKPKILFADEPTGNLDKKNAEILVELLDEINIDFKQTIIITTHNPQIAEIGHSKYELENGLLKNK